ILAAAPFADLIAMMVTVILTIVFFRHINRESKSDRLLTGNEIADKNERAADEIDAQVNETVADEIDKQTDETAAAELNENGSVELN
ncbi:MAG: hypothetical protein K2H36_02410, partial [Clostridia bacterium]|nr:hypothetical protein [Clostridia bacterium]